MQSFFIKYINIYLCSHIRNNHLYIFRYHLCSHFYSIYKYFCLYSCIYLFRIKYFSKPFMQSLWRETYISLQNTILKAFCSYSLPSVGFTAPSGPVRGSAPSFVSMFSLQPFLDKPLFYQTA